MKKNSIPLILLFKRHLFSHPCSGNLCHINMMQTAMSATIPLLTNSWIDETIFFHYIRIKLAAFQTETSLFKKNISFFSNNRFQSCLFYLVYFPTRLAFTYLMDSSVLFSQKRECEVFTLLNKLKRVTFRTDKDIDHRFVP